MPAMVDVSVVLPVYDEKDNLAPLFDQIAAALEPTGKSFEIVAVDDGSHDGSRQLLEELAAQRRYLKVVLFRRNCGQTAALDAGFHYATGNYVVTLDSDLQNDPADIPRLIEELDRGADVVSGWRKERKDGFFLRRIPSRIANWIIRRVTATPVHDLGCSLKAYRRHVTDEMRLYGEMHRFIAVIAEGQGARITELVVNHRPRIAGKSKYGLKRTVKVLLDLVTVMFLKRYHTKPIYIFGGLGFLMAMAGFILCAVVAWQKFALDAWVHRNPLFIIAAICFVASIQLLLTGVVAEMVTRTYFESQRKTAYSVERTIGFAPEPPRVEHPATLPPPKPKSDSLRV